MQTTRVNPFTEYASKQNLDDPSSGIPSLLQGSIKAISQNALTVDHINGNRVREVVPISIDQKTLRLFIPSPSMVGYAASFMPQVISSTFGLQPPPDSPESVKDFFDFIASHISELAHVEIGEEKKPFTKYLLQQHKTMRFGLLYLSEWYRLHHSQRGRGDIISDAEKVLECIAACCELIEGHVSYHTSRTFDVLTYDTYAPVKKILECRKHTWEKKRRIEKTFGSDETLFFAGFLSMKRAQRNELCTKIEKIFTEDKTVSRSDQLCAELLQNQHFSSMHTLCVAKLLRRKKGLEFQGKFEQRANGTQVKAAMEYVKGRITEIKSKPESEREEQLINFLQNKFNENLYHYKPFQGIYNILFHHLDTPKIEGYPGLHYSGLHYPGLPFTRIGGYAYSKFIAKVILSVEDIGTIDITTREGRFVLLQCTDFLFLLQKELIDMDKFEAWAQFFPEYSEFPNIQKAVKKSN